MKRTMTDKEFKTVAYDIKGNVLANGPKCATCGDLAAWGTHPMCDRSRGKLILEVADRD